MCFNFGLVVPNQPNDKVINVIAKINRSEKPLVELARKYSKHWTCLETYIIISFSSQFRPLDAFHLAVDAFDPQSPNLSRINV